MATSDSGNARPMADQSLAGRVAIVTGASSGLGHRFARVLAAAGARVIVTARRVERLQQLVDEHGGEVMHAVAGDIADPAFPPQLVEETLARFGRLDILVNNAGINNVVPAEQETAEDFMRVLSVNVLGVFLCCREAFPQLKDGGAIVNIASIMGLFGIGKIPQASYCASKGAVVNLTRELAVQWARHGIRVNAIAPGLFPSEVTSRMIEEDERSMAYYRRIIPMRRPGDANELDGALLFLAGPGSSYVTGQTLVVDGGWTAW